MATVSPLTRIQHAVVPPADARVDRWHVSPVVDLLAYHGSWLLVLVPLLFFGADRYTDYLHLYVLVMVVSFTHRHFTFPYVYFDPQIFRRFPVRFVVAPALAVGAFIATIFLYYWKVPALFWSPVHALAVVGGLGLAAQLILHSRAGQEPRLGAVGVAAIPLLLAGTLDLFVPIGAIPTAQVWMAAMLGSSGVLAFEARRKGSGGLAFIAPVALLGLGLASFVPALHAGVFPLQRFRFMEIIQGAFVVGAVWNVWHVYMQKFGIFRMYSAKSGVDPQRRTPHAVDRLLVFSWVPLVVVSLAVTAGDALSASRAAAAWAQWIGATVAPTAPVLLPLGWLLVAVAVALFLRGEWKADRWSNPARLTAALSLVSINAMFLFFDPIKVYIAFGFAHAIEYMVFVWAFQRRRYQAPLEHRPLMGWLTRRPWLLYGGLLIGIGGTYMMFAYGHRLFGWDRPEIFGVTLVKLAFYWTIWQQLLHFWFDGFLWKMRVPANRASL